MNITNKIEKKVKNEATGQKSPNVATIPNSNLTPKVKKAAGTPRNENPKSLNNRELTFKRNNEIDDIDVIFRIEILTMLHLSIINSLLPAQETMQIQNDDPVEKKILKGAEGLEKLMKNNLLKKYNAVTNELPFQFELKNSSEKAALMNALICWTTLWTRFQVHLEFDSERDQFMDSVFQKKNKNKIVENMDVFLNQVIIDLEKRKEAYFLKIFRILMDTKLSCVSKCNLVSDFFGVVCSKEIEESVADKQLQHLLGTKGRFLITFSEKTQILLDCLNKLNRVPKTLVNMKKGYDIFKEHSAFFKKLLPGMNKEGICCKKLSPLSSGKYYSEYNDICVYLEKIEKDFLKILQNAYEKNTDDLFNEGIQTPANNKRQNRNQRKQRQNQANQEQEIKTNEPLPIKSKDNQESSTKVLTVETVSTKPMGPKENVPTEPKEIIERKAIDLSKVVYIEEADENAVEEETNFLMELMRQICEKDRKQKLLDQEKKRQQKEEKERALKKVALAEETPKIILEKKAVAVKLNKWNVETLNALSSENPPHLKISGQEVKLLVERLKGRTEGCDGSKVRIFWDGSNEKAGKYKVAHEGDSRGYLTSEWAKRAGISIKERIESGSVVIEQSD